MSYPCPPNEGNTRNSDLRSASIAIRRSADPSAPELPRNEENEDEDSTERKAKARREANRLASMNSRQRRKALIKQLERTLSELQKTNQDQQAEIAALQASLQQARALKRQLKLRKDDRIALHSPPFLQLLFEEAGKQPDLSETILRLSQYMNRDGQIHGTTTSLVAELVLIHHLQSSIKRLATFARLQKTSRGEEAAG